MPLRVLITAGAAGLGRACAKNLLRAGHSVHIADINRPALDSFVNEFQNENDCGKLSGTVADVSIKEDVERVFDDMKSEMGGITTLVNSVGVSGPVANIEDIPFGEWEKTLSTNLASAFLCSQFAIKEMKNQRILGDKSFSGSIINISSTAGLMGCPQRLPYSASKWALIGMTKSLAMEVGPHKIRVNALCPTSVEGDRIDSQKNVVVDYLEPSKQQSVMEDVSEVAGLPSFMEDSDDSDDVPEFMRTGEVMRSPVGAVSPGGSDQASPRRTFDLHFSRNEAPLVSNVPGADLNDPDFQQQMREEAPREKRANVDSSSTKDEEEGKKFSGNFNWDQAVLTQAQEMQSTNQNLEIEAMEQKKKIKRLEILLEAMQPVPGVERKRLMGVIKPQNSDEEDEQDFRDVKIVSLAKKVRNLRVTVEKQKTKISKLERAVEEAEANAAAEAEAAELAAAREAQARKRNGNGDDGNDESNSNQADMKVLRLELRQSSKQVDKLRIKVNRQKQLTRKYYQALQKELGDQDVDKVLQLGGDGWRGRAQSIVMLRQKNKQLQMQVKKLQNIKYQSSRDAKDVDLNNRKDLRAMEEQRRAAVVQLGVELDEARKREAEMEQKWKASKARAAALSKDNKKARASIKTLLGKTANDDELVEALRDELEDYKERLRDRARSEEEAALMMQTKKENQRLREQNRKIGDRYEDCKSELLEARARYEDLIESSSMELQKAKRESGRKESGQVRMLQEENTRLSELLNMSRNRLNEAETSSTEASTACRRLQRQCAKLEKELKRVTSKSTGRRRSGDGRSGTTREMEQYRDTIDDLQERLDIAKEDHIAMKSNFQRIVSDKEAEIRVLREMAEEMKRQLNESVANERSKSSRSRGYEDGNVSLKQDNAYLRRELSELKEKYENLMRRRRR
eukprot:g6271.t1